jgi:hypothetical protein
MCECEDAWADFDAYQNSIAQPVEKEVTRRSLYFCTCGGIKMTSSNNMPTCSTCGIVDTMVVDESAEWTTGGDDSGHVDPARCGMPNDNELFSEQWGAGLVINSRGATYEVRRMAKISFHSSMNHKDRSLFHAYKDIESAALNVLNLPSTVIRDAKVMYKKFNGEKLTRGAVRTGVKANCVFMACKLANVPRTTKEIANAFGITANDISRTTVLFRQVLLGDDVQSVQITRPCDVLPRLLNDIELEHDAKRRARIQCTKLAKQLESCVELMSKTPTSIAAVIILRVLGDAVTKKDVCAACKISAPTITKIEVLVKTFLESSVTQL